MYAQTTCGLMTGNSGEMHSKALGKLWHAQLVKSVRGRGLRQVHSQLLSQRSGSCCQSVCCFQRTHCSSSSSCVMLKLHVEDAKMSITDMTVSTWTPSKHAYKGAEGVTFGKQRASTRTTESGSAILAVSAHRLALPNNRHISCARDAVVERVTATVQKTRRARYGCDYLLKIIETTSTRSFLSDRRC